MLDDATPLIWNVESEQKISGPFRRYKASVTSVAFKLSPEGRRVFSGSGDETIIIWGAGSVTFSSNGAHVVSGSEDGTVRVWEAESGEAVSVPLGHTSDVMSVTFCPDGKRIGSGSSDRAIRMWNVEGGKDGFSIAQQLFIQTSSLGSSAIKYLSANSLAPSSKMTQSLEFAASDVNIAIECTLSEDNSTQESTGSMSDVVDSASSDKSSSRESTPSSLSEEVPSVTDGSAEGFRAGESTNSLPIPLFRPKGRITVQSTTPKPKPKPNGGR
ncbi:WD40 repeat-like protein [Fomitiporia mediterranea MF3/22]|uniref:WD40 repeat-like protein n=1 Tax=Fomitiporia mediterranea (strain MF3/22) TaxID=694068 RepID=UPI0004409C27|nr:WD40 repeat-like protein [Fomitiporia mediterranea MF3/22]EJC99263.1 WD40 repeat-like protein [Fomitiporia mediterranea MF3/22]